MSETARLPPQLQEALRPVVAKNCLAAHHWQEVADTWDDETLPETVLPAVAKALGKVWPFKAPPWVLAVRQKAAALRQERQPGAGAGTAALAPEAAAVAPVSAAATLAPGSTDQTAAVAPVSTAAAAVAPVPPTDFVVGDIVQMGTSVAKAVQLAEAQVIKVLPKTLSVKIITGSQQGKTKSVRPDAVSLLQPSSLRSSLPVGRVPICPAEQSIAPGSAASTSAAPAPGSAAMAPATTALTPEEIEEADAQEAVRSAETLFAEFEDDAV